MTVFESQAIFASAIKTVELNRSPQQIRGMLVTPSGSSCCVFLHFSARFAREEGEIGADQEVILSQWALAGSCTPETNRPLAEIAHQRPALQNRRRDASRFYFY